MDDRFTSNIQPAGVVAIPVFDQSPARVDPNDSLLLACRTIKRMHMAHSPSSPPDTCMNYLSQLSQLDLAAVAEPLGVLVEGDTVTVRMFAEDYRISSKTILDKYGRRPSLTICVILSKYLLSCPSRAMIDSDWACYRDFRNAGPLTVFWADTVERPLASHFSGNLGLLETACKSIGGKRVNRDFAYDLCMRIQALPRIAMLVLFNDKDTEFPPKSAVLFERHSESYLDCESLAMLGSVLFSRLRSLSKKVP
jgi:hypothetical protein